MKFPVYLALLHRSEQTLSNAFRVVADGHGDEPDVHTTCHLLADQCDQHVSALTPVIQRYGESEESDEPERLHAGGLSETRSGELGLLRDLQDLYVLASLVDITWAMVLQAAQALRDEELVQAVRESSGQTDVQLRWLKTRMSGEAPQALIAAR